VYRIAEPWCAVIVIHVNHAGRPVLRASSSQLQMTAILAAQRRAAPRTIHQSGVAADSVTETAAATGSTPAIKSRRQYSHRAPQSGDNVQLGQEATHDATCMRQRILPRRLADRRRPHSRLNRRSSVPISRTLAADPAVRDRQTAH